eukprot:3208071-Prymnesium_polylepis.1
MPVGRVAVIESAVWHVRDGRAANDAGRRLPCAARLDLARPHNFRGVGRVDGRMMADGRWSDGGARGRCRALRGPA